MSGDMEVETGSSNTLNLSLESTKDAGESTGESAELPRSSPATPSALPSPVQTPSASPSPVQVKSYMKPVMPGYRAPTLPSVVIQRTVEVQQLAETDTNLRDSIPAMRRPLAIACLLCNMVSPGFGTFISGMSLLCCCSKKRNPHADLMAVIWVNMWVALLQLLTTFVFFLGWIWSVMWGMAFLSISKEYYGKIRDGETEVINTDSRRHQTGNVSTTTRTTTTTSVAIPEPSAGQSTAGASNQPIIVLQEAPITIQNQEESQQALLQSTFQGLNPYNPRHQRIIRRRMTEGEMPTTILSPGTIENIVINNVPVPMPAISDGDEESTPSYLTK